MHYVYFELHGGNETFTLLDERETSRAVPGDSPEAGPILALHLPERMPGVLVCGDVHRPRIGQSKKAKRNLSNDSQSQRGRLDRMDDSMGANGRLAEHVS